MESQEGSKLIIRSKRHLEILLSKVKDFENPKFELQQYITPPDIAALIVWTAFQSGHVENCTVCDLGSGTGILSIAAALMGAERVIGVEIDPEAIEIAMENLKLFPEISERIEFRKMDIQDFNDKVDTVIMNPPYGEKPLHLDRNFLEKAFGISDAIYSIHTIGSKDFLERLSRKNGFQATLLYTINFPIKWRFKWHTKPIYRFKAGIWRFLRESL